MFVFKCLKHNYQVTKTRIVLMIYRNKESLRKNALRSTVCGCGARNTGNPENSRGYPYFIPFCHRLQEYYQSINQYINSCSIVLAELDYYLTLKS